MCDLTPTPVTPTPVTPTPFVTPTPVEDAPGSRSPVKDRSPHFPIFSEFPDASYADRYNTLSRKLVQEKLYTAASVLVSPRTAAQSGDYEELSEFTGFRRFVTQLAGHVAAEAA